jgi:hypothetical protein
MVEDLRYLGQPISEETLVLDIIRGLKESARHHFQPNTPLSSFL